MKAGSARRLRTEDVDGRESHRSPARGTAEEEARAHRRGDRGSCSRRTATSSTTGRHPGARISVPDARIRGPLRHRLGLPYRVIGGPRFYERAEIRDALAYLRVRQLARPTISPSSASSTCRSAASATPPMQLLHDHRPQAAQSVADPRPPASWWKATDELKPKARGTALRDLMLMPSTAGAAAPPRRCRTPNSPRSCSTRAATPRCGRRTAPPTPPGRLENLKELDPFSMDGVPRTCRASSSTSRW